MRYYIISGEASGDLHGSNLIRELKLADPNSVIHCWGGDLMKEAGATLIKHYRDLAFMGFIEVVKNLPTIFKNLSFCKKDILAFKPDVLVLIDYPGFNMRIAKWARSQGLKIVYYISPQIWAWKENRIHAIKRDVDKMLVILPFEKEFYKKWQFDATYVGHPLVEVIERFQREAAGKSTTEPALLGSKPVIALLPGSRKQEIRIKLPIMLSVAKHFPDYRFIVAKAPGLEDEFYEEFFKEFENVSMVSNNTYALLNISKAALVTSGTATLETALFNVPEIICYKGSDISYRIAKKLIKIKYIGLVNLIMDKEVVKELIQYDLNKENIIRELSELLTNSSKHAQVLIDYKNLKNILQEAGNASSNAAREIHNLLEHSKK